MIKDTPNLKYIEPSENILEFHRNFSYWMDKFDEPQWFSLPKSSFGYILHEDSNIYNDLKSIPSVGRLYNIKQLGMATFGPVFYTTHTRYSHSIIMAIMTELILTDKNFLHDEINLGIISAMLHDIAMPPFSEQGKLANREELNEERNIDMVLGRPEFDELFKKYSIDRIDVLNCIRGAYPKIGKLINSDGIDIDKISYIAWDFSKTIDNIYDKYQLIDPKLFDIYEDIEFSNDNIYFTNPERVKLFLDLRAGMWKEIYFSSRPREAFLKRELQKLWNEGIIKKEKILNMSDDNFSEFLESHLKNYDELVSVYPPYEEVAKFYNSSINAVKKEFGNNFIIEEWDTFNPATSTKILFDGKIKEFSEVYPEVTKKIKDAAESCKYIGVYKIIK